MSATELITGWLSEYPAHFMRGRFGHLFIANGFDGPKRWDGQTTAAETWGITGPAAAPSVADDTAAGSISASKTYQCAYRYIDDETPAAIPSNISPLASVTTSAAANHRIDWTGLVASTDSRVIGIELWRTIGNDAETLYQVTFTGIGGATVTFIGDGGAVTSSASDNGGSPKIRLTLPPGHKLVVGASVTISGATGAGSASVNATHKITAVTATTADTDTAYTADSTDGTWTLVGYVDTDGTADSTFDDGTSLPIVNPNGTLSARRFVPPRDYKRVFVPFLDRYWSGVDAIYTTGTVTTNGTTGIEGSGTSWTSQMAGRYIYIDGETTPLLISSVTDSNTLVMSVAAATSASGKAYAIRPSPVDRNQIYYSEPDEPESWPTINTLVIPDSPEDDDEITGLMPTVSVMYVLKERHVFRMTYISQPQINPSVNLAASRGCVNQRSYVTHEDSTFMLDQAGIWRFDPQGSGVQPITGPIQDMFSGTTINWAQSRWFWAAKDPTLETIYFFVCHSGDTRPKHSIAYNLRTRALWTESYPVELGHGCLIKFENRLRLCAVAQDDSVWLMNEGYYDITAASGTIGGVATSVGAATLTDTVATFPTDIYNAPVAIVDGTGKGQINRITVRNSATQFTVAGNWNPALDTTSVYRIGAVQWSIKTGKYRCQRRRDQKELGRDSDQTVYLNFAPSTGQNWIQMRLWLDEETSAQVFNYTDTPGSNVSTAAGSADIEIDTKLTLNSHGNQSGWTLFPLKNVTQERSHATRYVQMELDGFQYGESQAIYYLGVAGVE